MASESPKFMMPNNDASVSGASHPDPAKPGPQDPMDSGPRHNTVGPGSHPGASPNKPAPDFAKE